MTMFRDDGWLVVILLVLFLALVFFVFGFGMSEDQIISKCEKLGQFQTELKVYECRVVKP